MRKKKKRKKSKKLSWIINKRIIIVSLVFLFNIAMLRLNAQGLTYYNLRNLQMSLI